MNWLTKKLAKSQVKKGKKDLKKYRKEYKLHQNTQKEKTRLIEAITAMSEMIELEEDNGEKTTTTHLKQKTNEQLADLLEEMLNEAEKNL